MCVIAWHVFIEHFLHRFVIIADSRQPTPPYFLFVIIAFGFALHNTINSSQKHSLDNTAAFVEFNSRCYGLWDSCGLWDSIL
jgi:hypothetical protein